MLSALVVLAVSSAVTGQVPLFTVAPPPPYSEVTFSSAVAPGNRVCFTVAAPVVFGVVVCDRDGDGDIDIEVPSAFGAVAINASGDFLYVGPTGNMFVQRGNASPVELLGSGGGVLARMNGRGDVMYSSGNVITLDKAASGRTVIAFVNQPIIALNVTPSSLRAPGLTEDGRVIFEMTNANTGTGAVVEADEAGARYVFEAPAASPEPAEGTIVNVVGIAVGADGDVWARGTVKVAGGTEGRWVHAPPAGVFSAVGDAAPFGNINLFGVDDIGTAFVEFNNEGLQTIEPDGTVTPVLNIGDTVAGLSQPVTFANMLKVSVDGHAFIIVNSGDVDGAQLRWSFGTGFEVLWSSEIGSIVDGAFDPAGGFDTFADGTSFGADGSMSGRFEASGGPVLVTTFATDFSAPAEGEGEGEGEGETGEGEGETGEGEGETGEGEGETGDARNFVVAIRAEAPLVFQDLGTLLLDVSNVSDAPVSAITVVVTITRGQARLGGALPSNCTAFESGSDFEGGDVIALVDVTCDYVTLPPGSTETVSIPVVPVGGATTLDVSVVGTTPDEGEDPAGNSAEASFPVADVGTADVAVVVKEFFRPRDRPELERGRREVKITVTNNGPVDAVDVSLSHAPEGLVSGCEGAACSIGNLAVGASRDFFVELSNTVERFEATVTTNSIDPDLTNNTAAIDFERSLCSATHTSSAPPSGALLILVALFARGRGKRRS